MSLKIIFRILILGVINFFLYLKFFLNHYFLNTSVYCSYILYKSYLLFFFILKIKDRKLILDPHLIIQLVLFVFLCMNEKNDIQDNPTSMTHQEHSLFTHGSMHLNNCKRNILGPSISQKVRRNF